MKSDTTQHNLPQTTLENSATRGLEAHSYATQSRELHAESDLDTIESTSQTDLVSTNKYGTLVVKHTGGAAGKRSSYTDDDGSATFADEFRQIDLSFDERPSDVMRPVGIPGDSLVDSDWVVSPEYWDRIPVSATPIANDMVRIVFRDGYLLRKYKPIVDELYELIVSHLDLCEQCARSKSVPVIACCDNCNGPLVDMIDVYRPIRRCKDITNSTRSYDIVGNQLVQLGDPRRLVPNVIEQLSAEQRNWMKARLPDRQLFVDMSAGSTDHADVLRAIIFRDQFIASGPAVANAHVELTEWYNFADTTGVAVIPPTSFTLRDAVERMVRDHLTTMRVVTVPVDGNPFGCTDWHTSFETSIDIVVDRFHYSYRRSSVTGLKVGYVFLVPSLVTYQCTDVPQTVPGRPFPVWYVPGFDEKVPDDVIVMSRVMTDLRAMNLSYTDVVDDLFQPGNGKLFIVDKPDYLTLIEPDILVLPTGTDYVDSKWPIRYFTDFSVMIDDPIGAMGPNAVAVGAIEHPFQQTHCYLDLIKDDVQPPTEGGELPPLMTDKILGWFDRLGPDQFVDNACAVLDVVNDGVSVHVKSKHHVCDVTCHLQQSGYDMYIVLMYAYRIACMKQNPRSPLRMWIGMEPAVRENVRLLHAPSASDVVGQANEP